MSTTLVNPGINIMVHLANLGDVQFENKEGKLAGSRNQQRSLQGFSLEMTNPPDGLSLEYMAHLNGIGDSNWISEGNYIGTRGQSRPLQGIAIRLTGSNSSNYLVRYKVVMGGTGDSEWCMNGVFCGTRNQNKQIEGIIVEVKPFNRPSKQHESLFVGLKNFNKWYAEGGEQKAGLPAGETTALDTEIRNYRAELSRFEESLTAVIDIWGRITPSKSKSVIRVYIERVINKLSHAELLTNDLIRNAALIETEIHEGLTLLKLHIEEDQKAIITTQGNLTASASRKMQLTMQLAMARSEWIRNCFLIWNQQST